jgi:hypothetical protein
VWPFKEKLRVAGIVSSDGGLRVIVGPLRSIYANLNDGEKLFILPKIKLRDHAEWNAIPGIVSTVKNHVVRCMKEG